MALPKLVAKAPSARPTNFQRGYVLHLYGDRVLPFDSATAEIAGALSDLARSRGHSPGLADIILAASARQHGLTVLSRNERHFAHMDAIVINPFAQLPRGK
jgi:toxin FitB